MVDQAKSLEAARCKSDQFIKTPIETNASCGKIAVIGQQQNANVSSSIKNGKLINMLEKLLNYELQN